MPVIGQNVTKRIDLPTTGAWVEIITNPKADLWQEITEGNKSDEQIGTSMIAHLITKWNFTLADGTAAPIDDEHVAQALSIFDVATITSGLGVTQLLSDAKKNS